MFVLRPVGVVVLFWGGTDPNEDINDFLMSCFSGGQFQCLVLMLSLVSLVTPCQRHGVSFSDVLETDELQMIAAAYVSSPGPAEESPFDLFPPSSSSALQLALADGRASFVPGNSSIPAPGALPRGLGPPGLPLLCASCTLIFSNRPTAHQQTWVMVQIAYPVPVFHPTKRCRCRTPRFALRFLARTLRFCVCCLPATGVTPRLWRELRGRSTLARALEKFLTTCLCITFQNGNVHFTTGLFK